jgi:hypothetical protein
MNLVKFYPKYKIGVFLFENFSFNFYIYYNNINEINTTIYFSLNIFLSLRL